MTLLTTRLAERRGSHQGLPRIRPPIRMGMMGVVDCKIRLQTGGKILRGTAIAAREKPTGQNAQPPCSLGEPCTVCGRNMEPMLVSRSAQERPPLGPAAQRLGTAWHAAPLGDQAADVEAPLGMEIIHHPVVALPSGEVLDDGGQRRGNVLTGTCRAQMPDDVSRGDDKRGEQGAHPMPDVLVLAFLRFPWGHGRRRILPLQHLPTRLCSGADDHTTVLAEAQGMERERTNGVCCGLKVGGVAVEPRDTPMGFEVRLIQNPPETRPPHRPGAPLGQGGDEVVETPARGGTVVPGRFTGGHRHDIQTRGGGKSAAADLGAAHLAGH